MKKFVVALLCITVVLVLAPMVMAGVNPGTGITSTSHDLSSHSGKGDSWDAGKAVDPTLDRICIYCHAPHHTLKAADAQASNVYYYPLWNHQLSTIKTYDPYSDGTDIPNNTAEQLNGNPGQPGSASKLCLSCHDGSVAIASYGYYPSSSIGNPNGKKASGRILIGGGTGNLQNHHPISFDYTLVAAIDDGIKDPSSVLLGGTGGNPYNLSISDLLNNNKMECVSCHSVHNKKNTGMKFLWVEDTNSQLCFSCHNK